MNAPSPNQLGEFPVGSQKLAIEGQYLSLVPDGNTVDLSTIPPGNPFIVEAKPADQQARIVVQNTNEIGQAKLDITNKNGTYSFWHSNEDGPGLAENHLQLYGYFPGLATPIVDIDPTGNVVLPSGLLSAYSLKMDNPPRQPILPSFTSPTNNKFGNLRPVFWDSNTNSLTIPQDSLIRYFPMTTPSATGSALLVFDTEGRTYSSDDWICCVAGFANAGGDRSYQAYCSFPRPGALWSVQYDQASSGNGTVWILAVSTQLMGNIVS